MEYKKMYVDTLDQIEQNTKEYVKGNQVDVTV